jgi:hypothetical protein
MGFHVSYTVQLLTDSVGISSAENDAGLYSAITFESPLHAFDHTRHGLQGAPADALVGVAPE